MRSGLITIAIALLYIFVSSCGGSSGGDSPQNPPSQESMDGPVGDALSENQIKANPILQVFVDRDTYVTYLEPANTAEELNLTGSVGFDSFSYVYEQPINHTVCWSDENLGAAHFMTVSDSTGAQVLRVEANGECATELVMPGIYQARLDHDNLSDSTFSIFIVPQFSELASNESSIMDVLFSKLKIVFFPHPSHAQTDTLDITTMITTDTCANCNLGGIIFRGQNLSGVYFEGSDISGAVLEVGDFSSANLSNVSLSSSDLRGTNFDGADLKGADLRFVEIDECTNFSDADLTGAVWIDNCVCANAECSNCTVLTMVSPPTIIIGEEGCILFDNPIVDDPGEDPIVGPIDIPDDIPISTN